MHKTFSILILIILYFIWQVLPIAVTDETAKQKDDLVYRNNFKTPSIPFSTDGCSVVPDLNIRDICITHDIEYWLGGDKQEKENADNVFYESLREKNGAIFAYIFYVGVKYGGSNSGYSPFPYRFGYGFPFGSYEALVKRSER